MHSQRNKALRLMEHFGGKRNGEFCPSGNPVSRLADEYGTPFYLYHGQIIVDQLRRVRAALGPGVEVFYSVKANPSLAVCQLLAKELAGAEVASAGELVLAQTAGFAPRNIVFAGPGKTDMELERALAMQLVAVNVESLHEINRLAVIAERRGCQAGIGLRLNPSRQLIGSHLRMGGLASQFGLDQTDWRAAIQRVTAHPNLVLRGIHVYSATQLFDVDALLEQCQEIFEIGCDVADQTGHPLSMIDFGGGFGVPYFENMPEFDLERFGSDFRQLVASYRADRRLDNCRFIFELGRYLVAEAGIYVTHVVDLKRSRGKTFVVTDGGMNHHLTATGNLGQVFRKPYPLLNLSHVDAEPGDPTAVVGPCCTPLDVFGAEIPLAGPEIGDLIGVFYSGAYGLSASSVHFLSHPTPAEVLLWQDEAHLIRPLGQPEDVLRGQRIVSLSSDPASAETNDPRGGSRG
jgi:diaminopimelate decarboxylase